MSRGKKIICNETGTIYDSISDAERKLNYSSGKLSKYVKSGDSIDNMTFSYYVEEEVPKVEEPAATEEPIEESVVETEPNSSESEESEIIEEPGSKTDSELVGEIKVVDEESKTYEYSLYNKELQVGEGNVIESSDTFKYGLASRLRLRGYDCGVVKGVLTFFNVKTKSEEDQPFKHLLLQSGYQGKYMITCYNSDRFLEMYLK